MPNASHSNGRDTRRASQEPLSNSKDPPHSRRARLLAGCDNVETLIQERQTMSKASDAYWQLEWAFAKHYSQYPHDEEYFSLLADCHQMRLVLETISDAQYTFLEVLTSTLTRHTTSVEGTNHTGEHKFSSAHSLSSRVVPRSISPTWPEAIHSVLIARVSIRTLPSLSNDEEDPCVSIPEAALKAIEDLRAVRANWARVNSETNKNSSSHESQIPPKRVQMTRIRTETSSMNMSMPCDAQEPVPCSPNKTNELLKAREIPFKSSEAAESAKADKGLDDDATDHQDGPGVLTPNHGEVSATTRSCVEGKTIVRTEGESSASKHSPIAEAALTLPSRSPVSSTRVAPASPRKDEPKLSLEVPRRNEPKSIVNIAPIARVKTRRVTVPGARSLAPDKAADRSGDSSPFCSELRSTTIIPSVPTKVSSSTRPRSKTVVSKERTSTHARSPPSSASPSLPKPPPAISGQAALHRPSNDETKMPSLMASKTIRQPVKKVDVSNKQANMSSRSPVPKAAVKLPAPATYKWAAPSRSLREEPEPPLLAAPKSTRPVVSKRVTKVALCSPSIPIPPTRSTPDSSQSAITSREAENKQEPPIQIAAERRMIKTSVNTKSIMMKEKTRQAAGNRSTDIQQPDSRLSNIPGEVKERRRVVHVVDKKNKAEGIPRSPSCLASPIPSRRLAPVLPKNTDILRRKKDKSNLTVPMEVKVLQLAKTKTVNTLSSNMSRNPPIASATRAMPEHSAPVLLKRSASSCLPSDEHKPLVEVVTARRASCVVSTKQTTSSKDAYRTTETRTRAPVTPQRSGDFSSTDCSKLVETTRLERAVEDKLGNECTIRRPEDVRKYSAECSETDQGLAIEQAHSSLLSGKMGRNDRPTAQSSLRSIIKMRHLPYRKARRALRRHRPYQRRRPQPLVLCPTSAPRHRHLNSKIIMLLSAKKKGVLISAYPKPQ